MCRQYFSFISFRSMVWCILCTMVRISTISSLTNWPICFFTCSYTHIDDHGAYVITLNFEVNYLQNYTVKCILPFCMHTYVRCAPCKLVTVIAQSTWKEIRDMQNHAYEKSHCNKIFFNYLRNDTTHTILVKQAVPWPCLAPETIVVFLARVQRRPHGPKYVKRQKNELKWMGP